MGRKIKGRKHHGVRDPEAQREAREAKFKGKINSAPINPDDQEIPRKLRMISQFMSKEKTDVKVSRKPEPVTKVVRKKKLLDSGPSQKSPNGEKGAKPLRNIPRFKQMPGESEHKFFRRVDQKVKDVIRRQSYEKKFNVEVSEDPLTGKNIIKPREKDENELAKEEKKRKAIMKKKGIVIRTKEEKRKIQRERQKLRNLKKKGKLPLSDDEESENGLNDDKDDVKLKRCRDFSELQDDVAFNEVVHAPPSFSLKNNKLDINLTNPELRKPASKGGLLVEAMLKGTVKNKISRNKKKDVSSHLSLAQKEMIKKERSRVIEQYRALKNLKYKEKNAS